MTTTQVVIQQPTILHLNLDLQTLEPSSSGNTNFNENKPITFTRDCHDVPQEQAIEALNIIRDYKHETTVLGAMGCPNSPETLFWLQPNGFSQTQLIGNVGVGRKELATQQ